MHVEHARQRQCLTGRILGIRLERVHHLWGIGQKVRPQGKAGVLVLNTRGLSCRLAAAIADTVQSVDVLDSDGAKASQGLGNRPPTRWLCFLLTVSECPNRLPK